MFHATSSHTRWAGIVVVLLAAASPPAAGQLVKMYELTPLEVDGGGATRAYALNNTGQIVGSADVEGTRHAIHWHYVETTDLHGTVHLGLLHPYVLYDANYAEAYDISDADQVVGTARTEVNCPQGAVLVTLGYIVRPAVLTDPATPYPGDALTNVFTFGDPCIAYDSVCTGISNANHVVGWADTNDLVIRAFIAIPSGDGTVRKVHLGTLAAAADPVSSATAVNDFGEVTGYSYTEVNGMAAYHAFIVRPADADADGFADTWSASDDPDPATLVNPYMSDIGTLGGTNSWGRAINNAGQIVGESDVDAPTGEHYTRAFLWDDGLLIDLGSLRDDPNHGFSSASGINNAGVVVGWAENESRQRRAFIYEDGQMKDLNDLLYLLDEEGVPFAARLTLTEARDINDNGHIVGWGTTRSASGPATVGFLLTPIMVDPSTLPADDGTAGGSGSGDGGSSGSFSGTPIFGIPEHITNGTTDENGGSPTASPAFFLCGGGTLAMLPFTAAGLWFLRGRRRY